MPQGKNVRQAAQKTGSGDVLIAVCRQPVGLNIFVIRNIAPDIPLRDVIWGTLPFVLLMALAVVLLCLVPSISTLLPNLVMGPPSR